jgi:phosphoribosylformimino-5-aminoimidazole carboxamide ribotide isomerase
MYLLPAIDLLDGKVVRLAKGSYNHVTVYNDNPVLQAQLFEEAGAEWLHVVDLNGAKSGALENLEVIQTILAATTLKVEVGGGVRSLDAAQRLLEAGATRVVFGTALVRDPALAERAITACGPDALVAGIDARKGEVAISGWVEESGISAFELAARMASLGYEHVVCTDISRDGMQTGVDAHFYDEMAHAFNNPVIVSGGIATADDILGLAPIAHRIEGVIAGRALYEGSLSVEAGVAACANTLVERVATPDFTKPLSQEDLSC